MDSSSEIVPVQELQHAASPLFSSSKLANLPRLLIPPHNDEFLQHSFVNESPAATALPAHLEAMWHYECVVSPRSPASPSPRQSSSKTPTKSSSPLLSPAAAAAISSPRSTRLQNENAFDSLIKSPRQLQRSSLESSRSPAAPLGKSRLAERVFSTFDLDGDGRVTAEELSGIFKKLGIATCEDTCKRPAVIENDDDVSVIEALGHVDWEEFLELCRQVGDVDGAESGSADLANPDLLAAFHVFDKDRNGFISPEELQSVLCSLGFAQHANSLEACVDMIARVDENGDGQIDFFEFKKMLGSNSSLIISPTC